MKKFWDKFIDPLEYFRLKTTLIMLCWIAVYILEVRH
jgi:hypothetical protein